MAASHPQVQTTPPYNTAAGPLLAAMTAMTMRPHCWAPASHHTATNLTMQRSKSRCKVPQLASMHCKKRPGILPNCRTTRRFQRQPSMAVRQSSQTGTAPCSPLAIHRQLLWVLLGKPYWMLPSVWPLLARGVGWLQGDDRTAPW
jgi:hypothetical protein